MVQYLEEMEELEVLAEDEGVVAAEEVVDIVVQVIEEQVEKGSDLLLQQMDQWDNLVSIKQADDSGRHIMVAQEGREVLMGQLE